MPLNITNNMTSNSKKISQLELRRFMNAHKRKALDSLKKIESPLAKYSENGELTCIVCNSVVKSEAVWSVHINSKQHKENIAKKTLPPSSQRKDIFIEPSLPVKKAVPSVPVVTKKPKSILKNATPLPPTFFDDVKVESEVPAKKIKLEKDESSSEVKTETTENDSEIAMETDITRDTELPEGFFDDPVLDAKARNVEYKDPVEEEWERFQKEIKEETDLSAKLIHEDTEDATVQRQIEQIDEQISKLSRVVQLEMKKDEVKAKVLNKTEIKKEDPSLEESDDSDLEVEFDWRAKSYLS